MLKIDIHQEKLTPEQKAQLQAMWLRCIRRIIASTTLAGSGHPGGSMSSLHILLLLYSIIEHRPEAPSWPGRDRLVVSMGHISPGVYSVLAEFGYFSEEEMLLEFRRAGASFAGHVEHCVPGIEWNTGNLGQGLSAATGMALALKLKNHSARVIALMGDGEQQKGQIAEARRFAVKYRLSNLIGIVDRNHRQIGGDTEEVMPQRVRAEYEASRWNVIYVEDGHNFDELFGAMRRAFLRDVSNPEHPTVIVARTIMGKGVSFMENKEKYHGSPLSEDEAAKAFEELGVENPIPLLKDARRSHRLFRPGYCEPIVYPSIDVGIPRTYDPSVKTDNRSAYGTVLEDLARLNNREGEEPKILGFSCDLEGSVKMSGFRKISPQTFFECGIQEHHAATLSGAISKEGFVTFFSTFGVFGGCETYNQHRLNDINNTHLKLVCTHLGLDVGEDGQTHQCIDYIGLFRNLFGWSIFIPADPNQTDRIVRFAAKTPGNIFVGMGRSKVPVITDTDGNPFFGEGYVFTPGRFDWVRQGRDGAIMTYGPLLIHAIKAWEELSKEGIQPAVINCASIKPFDRNSVIRAAESGFILAVEDHHIDTGIGAMVGTIIAEEGIPCRLARLGVKHYGSSGSPLELYRMEGIDSETIVKKVMEAREKGWIQA
ncbi:MAG: transketolase [Syntrophobacterales bacterium]|nr:transketolase [Syntrophobacterales bacterium]